MRVKDEPAAIGRAVDRARELTEADLADVLTRLEKGEPAKGLIGKAYVEEIANDVSHSGRKFLIDQLKTIQVENRVAHEPDAPDAAA